MAMQHSATISDKHRLLRYSIAATCSLMAGALLWASSAEARKIKQWFDQKSNKALVTFAMRDKPMTLQSIREKLLNRQDHKIQVLTHTSANDSFPTAVFVVQDLGYTNAAFTMNAGDDMRPSTSLKNLVQDIKNLGEVGKSKNRYGAVDYQFYSKVDTGQCLYIRQYTGWDASGDVRGGGTTLGSTLIHGMFCNGKNTAISFTEVEDFITGYTAKLN